MQRSFFSFLFLFFCRAEEVTQGERRGAQRSVCGRQRSSLRGFLPPPACSPLFTCHADHRGDVLFGNKQQSKDLKKREREKKASDAGLRAFFFFSFLEVNEQSASSALMMFAKKKEEKEERLHCSGGGRLFYENATPHCLAHNLSPFFSLSLPHYTTLNNSVAHPGVHCKFLLIWPI